MKWGKAPYSARINGTFLRRFYLPVKQNITRRGKRRISRVTSARTTFYLSERNNNGRPHPALPSLSFRFRGAAGRDGEPRNLVPGTNERGVPSWSDANPRRMSRAHAQNTRSPTSPRGHRMMLLPRNPPRRGPRVRAGRNSEFHESLRCERNTHPAGGTEHRVVEARARCVHLDHSFPLPSTAVHLLSPR